MCNILPPSQGLKFNLHNIKLGTRAVLTQTKLILCKLSLSPYEEVHIDTSGAKILGTVKVLGLC